MMQDYQALNSEVLRYAEDAQATAKTCLISFKVENEGISTIKARITNISLQPDEESYLQTDNGLFIRFNKLVSIDGLPLNSMA